MAQEGLMWELETCRREVEGAEQRLQSAESSLRFWQEQLTEVERALAGKYYDPDVGL